MAKSKSSAIGKVGILLLIIGIGAQFGAYTFWVEDNLRIGKMNFSDDSHVFGWYFQGLAILLGILSFFIGLKLKK